MLSVHEVTTAYQGLVAISAVSIEVAKGEIVCVADGNPIHVSHDPAQRHVIQVFVAAFTMLALSSLSRSRRFVGIMYAGIVFFTAAMNQALGAITGSRAWAWISPGDKIGRAHV